MGPFRHYSDMRTVTIKRKGLVWLSLWGVLVYDLVYGVMGGKGWSRAGHIVSVISRGKGQKGRVGLPQSLPTTCLQ